MPNSPNMTLPLNTVGSSATVSPTWANNVNSALSLIDQHNHSSGQGVQITPSGLNISSDLSFLTNNAINLRAVRMVAQNSPIAASGLDLQEIYVSGVDLYYNDGSGNQIQLTKSGGVAGTSGSIGGLTSPASATYVSATPAFVFQSAASTSANLDGGSLTIRQNVASAKGITLQSPGSLAANYSVTLPSALPAAQSFLTLDNSGNAAAPIATANGLTRSNLAAVGQQTSSSCGSFNTSSGSPVQITNQSVSLTTTGRPVIVIFQPDGNASLGAFIQATGAFGIVQLAVDGGGVAYWEVFNSASAANPGNLLCAVVVGAGSHTFTMNAYTNNAGVGNVSVNYMKMFVYEL